MERNWSVQIQITIGRQKVRYMSMRAKCVSLKPIWRAIRNTGTTSTTGDTNRLVMNQNQRSFFPRNSKRASANAAGQPRQIESAVVATETMIELIRETPTLSSNSTSQ